MRIAIEPACLRFSSVASGCDEEPGGTRNLSIKKETFQSKVGCRPTRAMAAFGTFWKESGSGRSCLPRMQPRHALRSTGSQAFGDPPDATIWVKYQLVPFPAVHTATQRHTPPSAWEMLGKTAVFNRRLASEQRHLGKLQDSSASKLPLRSHAR